MRVERPRRSAVRLSLFIVQAAASPLLAQGHPVVVNVVEATSQRPIAFAEVRLKRAAVGGTTDSSGVARFTTEIAGWDTLEVRRVGYASVSARLYLLADEPLRASVEMQPQPSTLASVEVKASAHRPSVLDQFWERRKYGHGWFVTPDQIAAKEVDKVALWLRGAPGVSVVEVGMGTKLVIPRAMVGSVHGGDCMPKVYVNGVLMANGPPPTGNPLDALAPNEVAAMELYTGPAQIPAQYNGTGSVCSVVLVWLKGT